MQGSPSSMSTSGRPRNLVALLAAVAALTALAFVVAGPAAAQDPFSGDDDPPCFGAAARDPLNPCRNPDLRLKVFPLPEDAAIMPNSPCTPFSQTSVLLPCSFGTPKAQATGTVALLGDSHASHWRAGLQVVADNLKWHGISITHASCPFSKATVDFDKPKQRACTKWNDAALNFFRRHPEINTIFVSEHTGGRVITRGKSNFQTQVDGYLAAWKALPSSVQHLVVIRDTPHNKHSSMDCVAHAIEAQERPGVACAIPRKRASQVDPATVAAHRWASPRVDVIDMTSYFCSSRMCLPVIGGVLVHKDTAHITQVFARTLGPYLQRAVEAAMGHWPVLPGGVPNRALQGQPAPSS